MFRKNYFVFAAFIAMILLGTSSLFAQAPIKGKIQMKDANGKVAPVEGATVDFYRMDAATGKLASVKTDAQGMYASESAPAGQVFAVVVSAPNASPTYAVNVKGGQTANLDLTPGNGAAPGEDEVREAIKYQSADPNTTEGKKVREELEKKNAEINAKNEKAKASNEVVNRALKEGNAAYGAQNYDLAISKYDEGYQAAPDFAGSAPTFLNNKASALRFRGFGSYKKSSTDAANKDALMTAAKKDYADSIAAYQQTLAILKTATAPSPDAQKNYDANKMTAMAGIVESSRLLILSGGGSADTNKAAVTAATDYAAVETDVKKKDKVLFDLGDALAKTGNSSDAVPLYRAILENEPDNLDAMANLGLALYDAGYKNTDKAASKEQLQEGLNYMEKFVAAAPDTNPQKATIKDVAADLKSRENLTPQKVTTTKTTKKKS